MTDTEMATLHREAAERWLEQVTCAVCGVRLWSIRALGAHIRGHWRRRRRRF